MLVIMVLTKAQFREVFVGSGSMSEEEFEKLAEQKEVEEIGIDGVIVAKGRMTDRQVGQLLAIWYNLPYIDLSSTELDENLVNRLPESFARTHELLPLKETEAFIEIATPTPDDQTKRSLLEKYLRKQVRFVFATHHDVRSHMHIFQRAPQQRFQTIIEQPKAEGLDRRVIELVNEIIENAYQRGVSDIHVEPEDGEVLVRYREDGVLHDVAELPTELHESLMTRLRVMSRLATDQRHAAQDGKILHKTPYGEEIEIRLSIIPTTHAEKAVMRLLSDKNRQFTLSDIGLAPEDFSKISNVIHEPWGMILVTGPTGSGKTTTLYSILRILNRREVNVTTIEDPVEYDIEGVNQIQVNEKTNLTFSAGLRSIVRQDPDIIMVGEIRDQETASISVNAAMTGHLVLSTLHTNDAATAFLRLADMEIEEYLVASTVQLVVAQRLVRKICRSCIQSTKVTEEEQTLLEQISGVSEMLKKIGGKEIAEMTLYKGTGCQVCHGSGYSGRIGIFELLSTTEAIREAVVQKKHSDEIRDIAMSEGMTTMLHDGLRKVTMGQTTLEEVLRVTR